MSRELESADRRFHKNLESIAERLEDAAARIRTIQVTPRTVAKLDDHPMYTDAAADAALIITQTVGDLRLSALFENAGEAEVLCRWGPA